MDNNNKTMAFLRKIAEERERLSRMVDGPTYTETTITTKIDWEQRRYEIAKEILPFALSVKSQRAGHLGAIQSALDIAELFIEQAKKRGI